MRARSQESSFVLTYIPEPGLKNTQRLGSQLTCAHTQKANFLSHSYRKQQLKEEEGSLEKQGGEKISHSMGMGPEENTAQTPDVETP